MKCVRLISILLLMFSIHGASAAPATNKILVMGDSLSAGYGINLEQGWVSLLQERITARYPYTVVNASVSGETSGGGLARLPALLIEHKPEIVVLELGGNDGLRGHPVNVMRENLRKMIEQSKSSGATVILLGMQIPPNYGTRYTNVFQQTFADLATKYKLVFVPFFLDQVAGDNELMQRDGIHPTAEAQATLLNNVWPALEPLLKK
jgi:acyl-CoA thioesterase-1